MEPLFPSPYFRGLILVTALGFMALEYALGRLAHRETHDWRESAATLGVAVVQNLVRLLEAGIVAIPFAFVYQHRLFDFSATSAACHARTVSWQRVPLLLAASRLAPDPLDVGDASRPSFADQIQPDGGDPARLDRQYLRQFSVLPAAGLDRISSVRRHRDARHQPDLSVLHPYRAGAAAGSARIRAQHAGTPSRTSRVERSRASTRISAAS